jgi:septum site-determining protein MinD
MTRFIAIAGAKGGVGKTTVAVNLGSALTEFGRETIIVDANVSKPNLGLHLGIVNAEKTVHTALAGDHKLYEAIFLHPSGLRVVPCHTSMDYMKHAKQHALLHDLLLELKDQAEIVLVDTASGFSEETTDIMKATGEVILVTTPDLTAVTDCLKTLRVAQEMGVKVIGVVATQINEAEYEMELENIETILSVPLIGVIPYDPAVLEAQHHKYPVVYTHGNSHAAIGYKKLAANFIGQKYEPDIDSKEGIMEFILQRTGMKKKDGKEEIKLKKIRDTTTGHV